jgi:hypothetical protein
MKSLFFNIWGRSWDDFAQDCFAQDCRLALRSYDAPGGRIYDVGFRIFQRYE